MAGLLKHRFVATRGKGKEEWNDSLVVSGGVAGQVMTRTPSAVDGWSWTSAGGGMPWVNVMDYGALGGGLVDDSLAIQNAIDAVELAGGGTVLFPADAYRVDTGLVVLHDFVHLAGLTPGQGTTIMGYGAINILSIGNGTDWVNYGSISNLRFSAQDTNVLRPLYLRRAHNYEFHHVSANGGTICCAEIGACYIQRWYGGEMQASLGHGILVEGALGVSNSLSFYGTRLWGNAGLGMLDEGGAGRLYGLVCESNAGGGVSLVSVRGFTVTGGYYEANTGFDIKVGTSCAGGTIDGYYLLGLVAAHKFIWLTECGQVEVGAGSMISEDATAGHVGVYVDAGCSEISLSPFSFLMLSGSTGTAVSGPGLHTSAVVLDRVSAGTGKLEVSGAVQMAHGAVAFASTGTWRTVAEVTFAATDWGGGYLIATFGGIQQNVGAATATVTGTFVKSATSNPAFTEITNVATNCTIQATNDGDTKIVVQMKSSATTNKVEGNLGVFVLGSAYISFVVTAPGYQD